MIGPFVHDIDPVIASVGGVHAWWYGLSYSLGFLNAHVLLRRQRRRLGLSLRATYELTLCLALGVLAGGRVLVVFGHEWLYYREHLLHIPAIWLGGLATHGLILGGAAGVLFFCIARRRRIRPIADALAVPAAIILACGRVGNFIDGQIVGAVTDLPWAVQFPDVAGFRHPVVLYDGLKNLMLVPVLLWVSARRIPHGRVAATFVCLYAALRIPIDLLREYPGTWLGLSGQTFNFVMAAVGTLLLVRSFMRSPDERAVTFVAISAQRDESLRLHRAAFAAILAFALLIPSDATRDVPARYGHRHPGLQYSMLYPRVGVEPQLAGLPRSAAGVQ